MSERRKARGTARVRAAAAGPLPAELMSGPCIEDWADKGTRPEWATSSWPAFRARRRWQAAVDSWAVESGWATDGRPASNARGLARTHLPWSRGFLIEQGRQSFVDYYEGRRATPPEHDGTWLPRDGPSVPST